MADRSRGTVERTVMGESVFKECAPMTADGRYRLGAGAEGPLEQGVHSLLVLGDRHHHAARLPGIAEDDAGPLRQGLPGPTLRKVRAGQWPQSARMLRCRLGGKLRQMARSACAGAYIGGRGQQNSK